MSTKNKLVVLERYLLKADQNYCQALQLYTKDLERKVDEINKSLTLMGKAYGDTINKLLDALEDIDDAFCNDPETSALSPTGEAIKRNSEVWEKLIVKPSRIS